MSRPSIRLTVFIDDFVKVESEPEEMLDVDMSHFDDVESSPAMMPRLVRPSSSCSSYSASWTPSPRTPADDLPYSSMPPSPVDARHFFPRCDSPDSSSRKNSLCVPTLGDAFDFGPHAKLYALSQLANPEAHTFNDSIASSPGHSRSSSLFLSVPSSPPQRSANLFTPTPALNITLVSDDAQCKECHAAVWTPLQDASFGEQLTVPGHDAFNSVHAPMTLAEAFGEGIEHGALEWVYDVRSGHAFACLLSCAEQVNMGMYSVDEGQRRNGPAPGIMW